MTKWVWRGRSGIGLNRRSRQRTYESVIEENQILRLQVKTLIQTIKSMKGDIDMVSDVTYTFSKFDHADYYYNFDEESWCL